MFQRLHGDIYTLDPARFFVPSFLDAVSQPSEERFRSMIVPSAPGIYTFDMLQPRFCEMLLAEVYMKLKVFVFIHLLSVRFSDSNMFALRLNIWRNGCMIQDPR